MYLADNIRHLRRSRHMSQEELADLLGYRSFTTIQRWEEGSSKPSITVLQKICDIFHVDLDALTGLDIANEPKKKTGNAVRIPVLGKVAAGIPMEAVENIIDFEEIPADWADHGEYFALMIKGNSMEPRIAEGDVVIVRKQSSVNNGDIAIVMVGGNEATCKKIKITEFGIILMPLNATFEPMVYSKEDIATLPITFLGKVVELRGKF